MRGRAKTGAKSPRRYSSKYCRFVKTCRRLEAGPQMVRPVRLRTLILALIASALVAAPSALAAPDPEIASLQVALRSKGMYFGKIDGVSGPMTAKGLRTFQRLTRLPVTGELGPRTRAELGALGRPLVARRVLVQGAYGWDVSALQFLLARAGHLRLLDVDGHFGASTKAALARFQKTRGLCSGRDRRPRVADGIRQRSPCAGADASHDDAGRVRRQARRHAHRDRGQSTRRPCALSRR